MTISNPFANISPAAYLWRTPRAIVMINDVIVKWIEMTITTSTYYVADTFQIQLPLYEQPVGIDLNYWASADNYSVKVYIGFPSDPLAFSTQDLELFIVGDADNLQIDPFSAIVSISGRDLTSRFIDSKTTQKFANNTSSQIATIFANNHGLGTSRVTATTTPVGVFYQDQQTLMTNESTEWDLLTFLAQQEDFVVFVQANDLVFEPRPTTSTTPFVLNCEVPITNSTGTFGKKFNGMSLSFGRSTTLASDVVVTVKSPYSTKTGTATSVTAKATHTPSANMSNLPAPSNKKQKYSYIIPGLTQEQLTQKAQQLLRDITQHEIKLTAFVPGENTLKKDGVIQVKGTGTAFDQTYFADQVVRTLHMDDGYNMVINAKNHSVNSQVSLE